MDPEPVTCSYIFTLEEFKKTQFLARRLAPWSEKLYLIGIVAFFGFFIGLIVWNWISSTAHTEYAFLLPVAVYVYVLSYVASRVIPLPVWYKTAPFQKSSLYNMRLINRLSADGLHSDDEGSKMLIYWSKIPRAFESSDGFGLYCFEAKKSFIWFPKHGFLSDTEIDRCRALIQEYVKDFRAL